MGLRLLHRQGATPVPVLCGCPSVRLCRRPQSRLATEDGDAVTVPIHGHCDCDFNLDGHGIRDIRGRVVSRLRPSSTRRGYATGYSSGRFTGPLAAPAITCAGHFAVFFPRFFS